MVSDENRRYPTSFGGWGPKARPLLRDKQGTLWFVVDEGADVLHNTVLRYYRQDGEAWHEVLRQPQLLGVQQNDASIMNNDVIESFGVIVGSPGFLEECTVRVEALAAGGCQLVEIDGRPLELPVASNYVGAAVLDDRTEVVWWTEVGDSTRPGRWGYVVRDASGWHAPVMTDLGPFTSLGYVYPAQIGPSELVLGAEAVSGSYPAGSLSGVIARLTLGEPLRDVTVLETRPGEPTETIEDVWYEPSSGFLQLAAHAQGGNQVSLFSFGARAFSPDQAPHPTITFDHTFRARFVADHASLHLLLGSDENQVVDPLRDFAVPISSAAATVDWSRVDSISVEMPGVDGFGFVTGVYTESVDQQTSPVQPRGFVVTGATGTGDAELWFIPLDG